MNKIKEFMSQKKITIDELEFYNPIGQNNRNYKEKVTPVQLLNYVIDMCDEFADIVNRDVFFEHVEKELNNIIDKYAVIVKKNLPRYFLTHVGKKAEFKNMHFLFFSKKNFDCQSFYFSQMHECVAELINEISKITIKIVSSKKKTIKIINNDIKDFISGKNDVIVFTQWDPEFRALGNLIMPLPNNLLDDMSEKEYSSEIKDKHKYDLRWN
jgi:hypothetical protein